MTKIKVLSIILSMKPIQRRSWPFFLIEKGAQFLFFFSVILVGVYLLGNFQEFLDESQVMLLRGLEQATLLGALLSLYGIVIFFYSGLRWGRFQMGKILLYVLLFIIDGSLLVLTRFFSVWFRI